MPRQVDHAQRRREIADALWRVVADQGVDAVSLRRVAGEAGVSMGLVQHYFHTRDEMLLFAFEIVGERVAEECGRLLSEMDDPGPRDRVRVLLTQWLPIDERRLREARALLAHLVSGRDDVITRSVRDGVGQLRGHVASEIAAAGAVDDPALATTVLLGLADGLTVHVLGAGLDPQDALRALDAGLDAAFGPEPPAST
ncbi:TetR/AcrR family transcriptional regulator [Pseudonocardia endophytica]|uniref:TetR family transcriptional regulator n=1 Tax=Pseudonocardia endophytica TaxID=401976 RepID=A0A4R1HWA5_PSEEN|nr:TetR/AcrR family transcriptional regulator [Pseudonocardia endophytica]TCK25315.1 TetR family transcriptional regulator [Pseudonocardia endophytica]